MVWRSLIVLIAFVCACSTSPVVTGSPWTFVTPIRAQQIDKVDLLFAIDDSPSMGDKQDLLTLAVPVLVGRLLNPHCVDLDTSRSCKASQDCSSLGAGADCDVTANDGNGRCFVPGDNKGGSLQCTTIVNTRPEFLPIHDMHIGIVSSSLGGGGSPDVCVGNDDKGHLLNRPALESAKPTNETGGNFLAWLPPSDPRNTGKSPPNVAPYGDGQMQQLEVDFRSLVQGVEQHGCELEAQLESWYRFLIQPDPYDAIVMSSDNPPRASLDGVDATLLAMRHDFLRPDSLVAIIQVTDEEDSWSDPLWLGGYGWTSRTANFPGGPAGGAGPRGTTECDEPEDINKPPTWGPNNPDCTSCAFPGSTKPVSGQQIGQDPNCNACAGGLSTCPKKGWYTPTSSSLPISAADGLNVRYGSQYMRARYGFDNQHDVQRYVDGLRSATAPDRDNEAHPPNAYSTTKRNCTNPLYAQDLPDGSDTSPGALCNLKAGSRTPDLVFYALIGGVPSSLVEDANGNVKLDLSADDWTKIVGKDPDHYIFDAIDPHMIESTSPRPGLVAPGTAYDHSDREWNTLTSADAIDLEYACTFDLPTPKDCTATANQGACDCTGAAATAPDGPPLCSTATRTIQIKGKAYPTIRELRVAKGLGAQSVVASLCAKDTTSGVTSQTYGYNPAMRSIVNRLAPTFTGECLVAPLPIDACVMLAEFPTKNDQSACDAPGLSQPPASLLEEFRSGFQASLGDGGATQPIPALCAVERLTTCGAGQVGWCYETNTGRCAQEIVFPPGSPPPGTTILLACTANIMN